MFHLLLLNSLKTSWLIRQALLGIQSENNQISTCPGCGNPRTQVWQSPFRVKGDCGGALSPFFVAMVMDGDGDVVRWGHTHGSWRLEVCSHLWVKFETGFFDFGHGCSKRIYE